MKKIYGIFNEYGADIFFSVLILTVIILAGVITNKQEQIIDLQTQVSALESQNNEQEIDRKEKDAIIVDLRLKLYNVDHGELRNKIIINNLNNANLKLKDQINNDEQKCDIFKNVYTQLNGKRLMLTKTSGTYYNLQTGYKETWYSEKILPGKGLKIPGRHVNSEGFVCDNEGNICCASSTLPKGTYVMTSRGQGKVYDCGCAAGTLDLYCNW